MATPVRLVPVKHKQKKRIKNKLKLSTEQKEVLDAILSGYSVFITGSAGTGKTVLMIICAYIRRFYNVLLDAYHDLLPLLQLLLVLLRIC